MHVESAGDIVERSRLVPLDSEDLGGGVDDLLPAPEVVGRWLFQPRATWSPLRRPLRSGHVAPLAPPAGHLDGAATTYSTHYRSRQAVLGACAWARHGFGPSQRPHRRRTGNDGPGRRPPQLHAFAG